MVKLDGNGIGFRGDSDGDGLSDGLEITVKGNPFLRDTNGDGISDYIAYWSGLPLAGDDVDGNTLSFAAEILRGTSPFLADTDHDGVNDNLDDYPLDPTRTTFPPGDPNDHTPLEIWLDTPANAIPVP